MAEKKGQSVEDPFFFQAKNYHGIEYLQEQDSTLYMKTCGVQRCLPGHSYPHNGREGYHLHVVLSGKGILRAQGTEYHIHKGQMFLLKDREDLFYQADLEDPWTYIWINYGGEHAGRYMAYAGFTDGIYVQDCNISLKDFFDVVNEIIGHPHLSGSGEFYRLSLAIRFLSLAIESREKGSDAAHLKSDLTPEDYVNYAARFMQGNYASVKITDVADYIGINRTYLTALFKAQMHLSPQEYLMNVRMEKSRELLLKTDLPINVVAREVGYEDQLAFSRMFRKKAGLSPEQYRKKHRHEYSL